MLDAVTEVYKSYLSTIVLPASLELDAICNVMPPPAYCTKAEKEAKIMQLLEEDAKKEVEEKTSSNSVREAEQVGTNTITAAVTNQSGDNNSGKTCETRSEKNKLIEMNTENTENANGITSIADSTQTTVVTTLATTTTTTNTNAENNNIKETCIPITSLANVTDAALSCKDAFLEITNEHNVIDDDNKKQINNMASATHSSSNANVTPELEFEDIREMRKRLRREEKERIRREHENAKKAREASLSTNDNHRDNSDIDKVVTSSTTTTTANMSEHNDRVGNQSASQLNVCSESQRVETDGVLHEEREKRESSRKTLKMEHHPVPLERDERKQERDCKLRSKENENVKEMNMPHKVRNDKSDESYQHHDKHRRHREHRDEHHRREHHNRIRSRSLSHEDKITNKYESSYRHNRHDDRAAFDGNARKRYREDSYDNKYSRYDDRRGAERDSNRPKRYDIPRERNDERRRRHEHEEYQFI